MYSTLDEMANDEVKLYNPSSTFRGHCVCPERAAPGHGKGEDADLPHHVPGVRRLRDVHLQTGGNAGSVPGNHARADGQHR